MQDSFNDSFSEISEITYCMSAGFSSMNRTCTFYIDEIRAHPRERAQRSSCSFEYCPLVLFIIKYPESSRGRSRDFRARWTCLLSPSEAG